MNSLTKPTSTATAELKKLNLSTKDFTDKNGKMKSMSDVFGILNEHTKNLSKTEKAGVFKALFGAEGQSAALILANNSKELDNLNKKVEQSYKGQGYVQKLAQKNMGSAKMSMQQFQEAGNALMITIGKALLPTLRDVSVEMAKAFSSKDGQRDIKVLGQAVGNFAKSLGSLINFMIKHRTTVKAFGTVLASAFAVFKTMELVNNIKKTVTAFKELAAVQKAMNVVSMLSPWKWWAAAIVAVGVALVAAYKHFKPFHDAVNKLGKALLSFGKSTLKFFKSNWKQLGLLIVNPIAGAFALLYKHNKKFRKFCNDLVKSAKSMAKKLGQHFSDGWKSIKKSTSNGIKDVNKSWNSFKTSTSKTATSVWKSTKKAFSDGWSELKKVSKQGADKVADSYEDLKKNSSKTSQRMFKENQGTFKAGYKVMQDQTKTWKDITSGHWDNLYDDTKRTASDMNNYHRQLFRGMYNKLNEMTDGKLGDMVKKWQSKMGSIGDAVNSAKGTIHRHFVDLVRGVIKPFNDMLGGIKKGINWVLDKIGSSKIGGDWSIPLPSYAYGTQDTHPGGWAKVNDGLTSHYREMYRLPNGEVGMFPAKRNMIVPLPKGTSVLDGEQSYRLMRALGKIPHYASGIGDFFSGLLEKGEDAMDGILENVDKILKSPVEFMKSVFKKFVNVSSPISFAKDLITGVPKYIAEQMKNWVKKQFEELANPGGSGVERWRPYIIRAFKQLGVEATATKVSKLLKQIQTESGGNPTIRQQVWDVNMANGNPAQGLLQFIPSTFKAWAVAGHKNILNGYDQILAAINALEHGGEGGWGNVGQGHGWAWGGEVTKHGYYEMAEGNMPEFVIPTDVNKRSRAYQLLGQVVARFQAQEPHSTTVVNGDSDRELAALSSKFDRLLVMFESLLQLSDGQIKAIQAQGSFDRHSLYKQQARDYRMKQVGLGGALNG